MRFDNVFSKSPNERVYNWDDLKYYRVPAEEKPLLNRLPLHDCCMDTFFTEQD